ncbi:MAG: alpha/beta hydrolase [Rhodoferax sp.]
MPTLYRSFASPAEIDAQYNPALGLADPAQPMAHYRAQAALARSRFKSILGIPYGPTKAETLDIFPADAPGAPVFVFLHGGYWRAYTSHDFHGVALGLQPLGITTVVVNYALCPWVSLDEIVRQARAAVAWVLRHVADYGGDPARVALGGHSAGAQLTAMGLLTDWAGDYGLSADPLRAAVLISGIYDIAPLRWSFLQPLIQLDDGLIRRNSPLNHLRPCATPVLTTWGQAETAEFSRQAHDFHAAWSAAGNASTLQALAQANHFEAVHPLESPSGVLSQWLVRALAA